MDRDIVSSLQEDEGEDSLVLLVTPVLLLLEVLLSLPWGMRMQEGWNG